eukprot:7082230-Lingulodinium_polyedra.AAC.1
MPDAASSDDRPGKRRPSAHRAWRDPGATAKTVGGEMSWPAESEGFLGASPPTRRTPRVAIPHQPTAKAVLLLRKWPSSQ